MARNGTKTMLGGMRAAAAALAICAAAATSAAQAQDLRLELGLPSTSPFHAPLARFADRLGEVGIDATVTNGSVLSLAEVCAGMRDGLVDGGLCLFPYNPAEFSEANLMSTMSMFATSGSPADHPAAAMTGAMMEYIFFNCPECLAQIKAQNHVYLGSSSTPPYDLLCRGDKQIESLEDFAGKRIRSGGSNFSRIAEHFGAVPVTMKGAEVFDGLDKGVLDCIMIAVSELVTLRLVEVTDQVMLGWPGGVYVGQNFPGMNRESWRGLNEQQRAFAIRAAADMTADGVYSFDAGNATGLAAGRDKGMAIIQADDAVKAMTVEFLKGDLAAIRTEFADQYGLEDVDRKLALAQDLIEKWKGLTNGDLNVESLSAIYWDQVFSKLDAATYGLD